MGRELTKLLSCVDYDNILDVAEKRMHEIGTKEFELGDFFCGGMYVRPCIVEPGDALISKVHGVEHPYFLMAGTIKVIDQTGEHIISAPYIDMTLPGTRRIALAIDRVLWVTVHRSDKMTVAEVEGEVITPRENKLLNG